MLVIHTDGLVIPLHLVPTSWHPLELVVVICTASLYHRLRPLHTTIQGYHYLTPRYLDTTDTSLRAFHSSPCLSNHHDALSSHSLDTFGGHVSSTPMCCGGTEVVCLWGYLSWHSYAAGVTDPSKDTTPQILHLQGLISATV